MSSEACDAHGGTWCAQPSSCAKLKECIEDEIADSGFDDLINDKLYTEAKELI